MKPLRLRAPVEHGQVLASPPLDQVAELLTANRRILSTPGGPAHGPPFAEVRSSLRKQILECSARYHQEAGESIAIENRDVWMVAGHQPELCHPGVWYKNVVLHQLARAHGAMALNLVIDTDLAKPALLQIPHGDKIARVPFDRSLLDAPYEESVVQDEGLFASLPDRAVPFFSKWDFKPLLTEFWSEVMRQTSRTRLLGERLAAARRAMERRFGVVQREVPMSTICETPGFAWFVAWIFKDLKRFHAIFNETVQQYRQTHGIRSRSHPVPDLATEGDWVETPFWAWHRGQHRRGRLFLRTHAGCWTLRVGKDESTPIPAADESALFRLMTERIKIRSRALSTTMFARLFFADIFIHGIGGGVYDVLTDRIIERFFGIPAPAYLTASATLILPLPRYPEASRQERQLAHLLRDLHFKPERFVQHNTTTEAWIRFKEDWIARTCTNHAERVERFRHIREINAQLRPLVQARLDQVTTELAACRRRREWHEISARRDYAFCLYPKDMLQPFFENTGCGVWP